MQTWCSGVDLYGWTSAQLKILILKFARKQSKVFQNVVPRFYFEARSSVQLDLRSVFRASPFQSWFYFVFFAWLEGKNRSSWSVFNLLVARGATLWQFHFCEFIIIQFRRVLHTGVRVVVSPYGDHLVRSSPSDLITCFYTLFSSRIFFFLELFLWTAQEFQHVWTEMANSKLKILTWLNLSLIGPSFFLSFCNFFFRSHCSLYFFCSSFSSEMEDDKKQPREKVQKRVSLVPPPLLPQLFMANLRENQRSVSPVRTPPLCPSNLLPFTQIFFFLSLFPSCLAVIVTYETMRQSGRRKQDVEITINWLTKL